ncbi:protein Mpv17 isoform X1 [Grus americana]|uniref:protein Mpv17 isoform X1 n=1 Tax=Grus americana TaxID=9117 RepID=UPI0024081101|nr:protein Mpv17 isoform X1 [Grus americana]XP_054676976.1 protein Mpv17 isoform X1 [Grus americana]
MGSTPERSRHLVCISARSMPCYLALPPPPRETHQGLSTMVGDSYELWLLALGGGCAGGQAAAAGSHLHPWLGPHPSLPHAEEASAEHPSPLRPLSPSWAAGQCREEARLPAESQPGWMMDSSCCRGAGLRHGHRCGTRTGQHLGLPGQLPQLGAHPQLCPTMPGRGLSGCGAGRGLAACAKERSQQPLPCPLCLCLLQAPQLTACLLSALACPMPAPALLLSRAMGISWEVLLCCQLWAPLLEPAPPAAPASAHSSRGLPGPLQTAAAAGAGCVAGPGARGGWMAAGPCCTLTASLLPRTTRTP